MEKAKARKIAISTDEQQAIGEADGQVVSTRPGPPARRCITLAMGVISKLSRYWTTSSGLWCWPTRTCSTKLSLR